MKTKIAALALLLMAGTAPAAFAQDQDHHDRGAGEQRPAGQPHEHQGGNGGGGDHAWRQQPAPAAAPAQAQQAPAAPQAREPRQGFAGGGRWGQRPDAQPSPPRQFQQSPAQRPQQAQGRDPGGRSGYEDGRRFVRRPGSWVDTNGDDTSQGLNPADRADHEDRQDLRDWRRYGGDRRVNPQAPGPDRRGFAGGPPDRRDDRQGDPRQGDRRQGDQRWTGDRRGGDPRWNGGSRDNHGRPEWRPGAYPHTFQSHQRYRYRPYLRPPHFFVHTWGFGEFLPPAWYGPEYVIEDWWDFDLPAPPYGYVWVRVGDDAILVDDYNGRVVQVVRALFW